MYRYLLVLFSCVSLCARGQVTVRLQAPAQTEAVSERIYTVATLIPGICYLIVFLIMQFKYPLTRKEVEKNTAILQEKRRTSQNFHKINTF